MKYSLVAATATAFLLIKLASLHGQQLPENYQNLELYELNDITKAAKLGPADKANTFINWMAANNWQALDLSQLYNLYSFINVDSVDRRHFSARWSGSIVAPASGAYSLRQVRQYSGTDSRLKILVDGALVLDSSGDRTNEARFISQPVQLTAGQPAPLQVEMVHDVQRIDFSEGAPMVVLTWRLGEAPEAIIPTTAFVPPQGCAVEESRGLKGESFVDMAFGNVATVRLDPALDLVSSWPPLAPIHQQESDAVFDVCKSRVLDDAFLANAAANGPDTVFRYNLWRIAYRMRGAERQQLVQKLGQNPEVLRAMTPEAMARLMEAVYMLPSKHHLALLGEWALERPQPRCQPGEFPDWSVGSYRELNTDYYWLMGQFLQGAYAGDVESLCSRYLVRPNGECNLAVAYAMAFAARANHTPQFCLAKLGEQIDDQSVQGDVLATWLIARSFARGVLLDRLQPMGGFSDLESAYVAAESHDYKFWALQEMVARLISVNKGAYAKQLIEERGSQFTTPAQQQDIASWIAKADELAKRYEQRDRANSLASKSAYSNELKRRREMAVARGDSSAVLRYEKQISQEDPSP